MRPVPTDPGRPEPVTVPAAEVRAAIRSGVGLDGLGAARGHPLLVVELDGGPDPGLPPRAFPCLVVAVAGDDPPPEPWACADILLAGVPHAPRPWTGPASTWLPRVRAAALASPLAAAALAQLLRLTATLPAGPGLVAESFAYAALQAGPEHRRWLDGRRPRPPRVATAGPAVLVDRDGPRLRVTLHRPRRHNAYGSAMRDELVAALAVAASDPSVEVVELTGTGPSFCSGGDLAEFGTAPDPATAHAVRSAAGAAPWLERCAGRTEAHVHGACVGAGTELAAFAARVVASPDAWFRLPEVAMGLVPGAGGTVSVPRRIGRRRATLLGVTGAVLDATTALAWGLVDEVRPVRPG